MNLGGMDEANRVLTDSFSENRPVMQIYDLAKAPRGGVHWGADAAMGIGLPLYGRYFRFLETLDEYFGYSSTPIPMQGRWQIYGLGLCDAILKRVYHDNAARL